MQWFAEILDDSLFGARAAHTMKSACAGSVNVSRREARRKPNGRRL
jgi:hypothetical protein